MNMGCMTPFEVRDLYVSSVSTFVCLVFSFLETQEPKTPVSCQVW